MVRISLAELGIDPADDAGCTWHPRADKTEVRDASGNLRDLADTEADEHQRKPEADEQYDGALRRAREARAPGAAEDSDHTPGGTV